MNIDNLTKTNVTENVLADSRASIDMALCQIDGALEKLDFLSDTMEDYLSILVDMEQPLIDVRQKEMYTINSMIADYLNEINVANEKLRDLLDL